MAISGIGKWFGSLFFRGSYAAKLSGPDRGDTQHPITPDVAMQLGTIWACVRLLSETIGTLPLGLYRKDDKGGRIADTGHALYALLHDSPNADQTAAEFWEAVVACLCLWGNFYAEIVRNTLGNITALNFLRPDLMTVQRDVNGARVYRYAALEGMRVYSEDEVFHVRGFGIGGDVGLSPIAYARKSLRLAIDLDGAAHSAITTGINGKGFVVVPKGATKEQKIEIRETFIDPITGPNSMGRAGILEQGLDWKSIEGLPPEDLQLLQARSFSVDEQCRWYRVPPFMIGHTEKTTSWGTGLEQQTIGFLTYAARPYLTRIEQAVKKQLVKPADRGKIYAEFILEGLLRADSAGRAAIMSVQAQNGLKTRNELRAKENDPPLPGGDQLTVQSNLVPLDQLGTASAGDQTAKAALMSWLGLDALADTLAKLSARSDKPSSEDE
jgi:HK97 family phage portal protein